MQTLHLDVLLNAVQISLVSHPHPLYSPSTSLATLLIQPVISFHSLSTSSSGSQLPSLIISFLNAFCFYLQTPPPNFWVSLSIISFFPSSNTNI